MRNYLYLLDKVHAAPARLDRTGTGTTGVFGPQMEFDLLDGFSLLTTKAVWFKGIVHELIWLLSGSTNIKPLVDADVHIWDEWADADGELGPVYGKQWRAWTSSGEHGITAIDQIKELLDGLKNNPFSRRHIVTAWNPSDIPDMALPPCHCLFQFYVAEARFMDRLRFWCQLNGTTAPRSVEPDEALEFNAKMDAEGIPTKTLSCKLYQRSADLFLGVPFNIASYALLTHMVAQVTNMIPANFIWSGGDVHLYLNHRSQAEKQLQRQPMKLPTLILNREVKDLFAFTPFDIALEGYNPQEAISAPVSV